MVYKDKAGLRGNLKIDHVRGVQYVNQVEIPNTIMNVGKAVVSSFIGSDITSAVSYDYIAIGTSGTAAAATQITLGSEQLRNPTTSAQATTSTTNDTARFIGSFAISGTHSIVEAGIFNDATVDVGSMLARTTFTELNVISGDSINATWDLIVA